MMAELFISYAHKDEALVYRLTEDLLDRGYDLWRDVRSLRLGEHWAPAIEQGVENATYFLLIVTANANRDFIKREIKYAITHDRLIVPIIIDALTLDQFPPVLHNGRYVKVSDSQGVPFPEDWAKNASEYNKRLNELVSKLDQVTPAPKKWDMRAELTDPDPTATIADLEGAWRIVDTGHGNRDTSPVGLLIGRTMFGVEAYLIAPRDAKLITSGPMQVFIHFSGQQTDFDRRFESFKGYLHENTKALWTVLVKGPVVDGEYRLPNDSSVWHHVTDFIYEMIERGRRRKTEKYEFYLDAPVALGMMLGASVPAGYGYEVYHFDDRARNDKNKYFSVR